MQDTPGGVRAGAPSGTDRRMSQIRALECPSQRLFIFLKAICPHGTGRDPLVTQGSWSGHRVMRCCEHCFLTSDSVINSGNYCQLQRELLFSCTKLFTHLIVLKCTLIRNLAMCTYFHEKSYCYMLDTHGGQNSGSIFIFLFESICELCILGMTLCAISHF